MPQGGHRLLFPHSAQALHLRQQDVPSTVTLTVSDLPRLCVGTAHTSNTPVLPVKLRPLVDSSCAMYLRTSTHTLM